MNIILIIILLVIILILIWALLGGKSDIADRREGGVSEEDKTFRRRASDKEIEKEFPESAVPHRRRKSDMEADEAAASAEEEQQGPFKLPYMADEIIPETSRFRIYRRTLLNSEIYATKGDYSTAISLFEGVRSRIQDIDTRFKIDADIEYLKQFKKKKEEDARRKDELAKRGATGEEGSGGEIKIKMGGLPSNAIKIDSLPETIHIGIIDPSKNVDMESIVKNVTDKLKSELSDVREELDRLKAAPQEDGEAAAAQSKLADALSGLTERLDSLESAREASAAGEAAAAVSEAAAEARAAVESLAKTDELADLKNEFKSLTKAVKDMAEASIPESATEPSLAEAKFDMGRQMDEARALKEMLDRIPKKTAPEPSSVTEPGIEKSEHLKRSAEDVEEKDDFELLSEYGKDKSGEELTDDEIFEKILREDKKERDKGDFEIIGEKKERRDEDVTTTEEIDMKQREDESFYRRLLSTTKRKTKELPILKVSYDFTKLPDEIGLSREKNIIEYSFYKYKPMLEKANEYIKKRKVRDAINYYKVVMAQNIPPEFKSMIRKNLNDLTEYLEKYLTGD
ncbi:MAG: hypothetical protein KA369_11670 [Spirochaetes bacterium]|nr:hypothetical protein [Spirochaetota bacterium]